MSTSKEQWEQDYIERIPDTQKGVFQKAYSGKSKAAGIKAKCLDCTNFQRSEVEICTVTTCPLFQYRPYKPAGEKLSITMTLNKKERPKRVLSAAQKENLRKGRENKED